MRPNFHIVFIVFGVISGTLPGCDTSPKPITEGGVMNPEQSNNLEQAITQVSKEDQGTDAIRKMPEHTASIIEWLPNDTESIFVCQEPFRLPAEDEFREAGFLSGLHASYATGFLGALPNEKAFQVLVGKKCNTAVLAGRKFQAPSAQGASLFEGVCVLRFEKKLPKDLWTKLVAESQQHFVLGFAVVEHPIPWGKDELVFSLALLNDSLLIIATDRDYLKTVLSNSLEKPEKSLLASNWEEWKHVDTQSPIWAIRHFTHFTEGNNAKDPTSPFYENRDMSDVATRKPELFEWNVPDQNAIGFTFSLRQKGESFECVVNYLSESIIAERIALIAWTTPSPDSKQPNVTTIAPNVIQVTFSCPIINTDDQQMFFMLVQGRLGHAAW